MGAKVQKMIDCITRLPGIGPRQAMRLILALSDWSQTDLDEFGEALSNIKKENLLCQQCFNFADDDLCYICKNPKRDKQKIAVVEKITDLAAMEKAGVYSGLYHVLGGAINPAAGVLPSSLKMSELENRIRSVSGIETEVILATNPTTQGETTALYIEDFLKPFGVTVTRLARGLAAGSTLEYTDETTLSNALKHRK